MSFLRLILVAAAIGLAGCTITCPDGTAIYDGADSTAVRERFGEPDLVAWQGFGPTEYSVPGVPGRLRCGNEPGTASYYYLNKGEVFRFDQWHRVATVDAIDIAEQPTLEARVAEIRMGRTPLMSEPTR